MTHGEKPSGESTIYGGESVFIEELLPAARKQLVTIRHDASLREAARLLLPGTDLVVVCGVGGAMVGVITKSDVVARIGHCECAACTIAVHLVLSANVLRCMPSDRVQDVWSNMKKQGFKNVPVVGAEGVPLGVLNARDLLGVLLQGVKYEESLLRDYVMGIGYR